MTRRPWRGERCKVEGCERPNYGKGLCKVHWQRLTVYGRLTNLTPEVRFFAKVNKDGPVHPVLGSRCWLWTGHKTALGYGRVGLNKTTMPATHAAWFFEHGEYPSPLWALHKCDNPPCVNPEHLFLGTVQDNTADMDRKGRRVSTPGEASPHARITERDVRVIRELSAQGISKAEIGRRFRLCASHVGKIVERKKWAHVR